MMKRTQVSYFLSYTAATIFLIGAVDSNHFVGEKESIFIAAMQSEILQSDSFTNSFMFYRKSEKIEKIRSESPSTSISHPAASADDACNSCLHNECLAQINTCNGNDFCSGYRKCVATSTLNECKKQFPDAMKNPAVKAYFTCSIQKCRKDCSS